MTTTSKRSPSISQARPDTLAASATSSFSTRAPWSRSRSIAAASRAVAVMRAPAVRYCRTNSKPMPRDAPMIKTFMVL